MTKFLVLNFHAKHQIFNGLNPRLLGAAKKITEVLIYTFLSEFGEFLPFAVIMENGEVIPLEHEANDKSSSPTYLINMYENYFNQERNNNNEYQLGLLCIDIYTRSTMQNCKRSGIEYILFGINYTKRIIQHYKVLKDKSVLFDDMVGWDSGNSLG